MGKTLKEDSVSRVVNVGVGFIEVGEWGAHEVKKMGLKKFQLTSSP